MEHTTRVSVPCLQWKKKSAGFTKSAHTHKKSRNFFKARSPILSFLCAILYPLDETCFECKQFYEFMDFPRRFVSLSFVLLLHDYGAEHRAIRFLVTEASIVHQIWTVCKKKEEKKLTFKTKQSGPSSPQEKQSVMLPVTQATHRLTPRPPSDSRKETKQVTPTPTCPTMNLWGLHHRPVSKVRHSHIASSPRQQGTSHTLRHCLISKVRHLHTASPPRQQGTSLTHCVTASPARLVS